MYCSNCGQQIPDTANNCPYCGATVERTVTYSQPTQTIQTTQDISSKTPISETQKVGYSIVCPRCGNTDPKQSAYSTSLFIFYYAVLVVLQV